jgi:aspartate racemase
VKTLGIIGGVGPESTIEYYRRILAGCRQRRPELPAPSILIDSVDNRKVIDLIAANRLPEVIDYLAGELERLERAGADFALVAANTPHIVFDELSARVSLPLIDIVRATCDAAKVAGLRRLALLGTRFTMQGSFYPRRFEGSGITLVTPEPAEQSYVHDKYMTELLRGVILPETHAALVAIIEAIKRRAQIDGVILGGTELSLILREPIAAGLPVLDTTQIHVEAAVTQLLA